MTASSGPQGRKRQNPAYRPSAHFFIVVSFSSISGAVTTTVIAAFRFLFIFLLGVSPIGALAASSPIDSTAVTPEIGMRIAHVYVNGNRVTDTALIRTYLGIDTCTVFDSAEVTKAKKRLEATNLFLKVTILHLVKNGTVDLYVIVKEPLYFGITAVDLTPYGSRYGKSGTWYCPYIGVEWTNLRGRMESLRLSLRLWEWRSAGISWVKPLFPSRYFIGMGAYVDHRPDNALPLDRLEVSGSISAGRKFFGRSKAYCSIIPDYQRKISWTASRRDTTNFYQAFAAAGWFTDHRSSAYDPSSGWSFFFETRTNYLYHNITTHPYVQFVSDVKFYHRGLISSHTTAYRVSTINRTNGAGIINRIVLGGEGSVRGYTYGGIDLRNVSNNAILASWEYRFPLYQLPSVPPVLPAGIASLIGKFIGELSDLAPRIDGALIFDYGRIAAGGKNLFSLDGKGYQSGTDFGFGLRVMEPTLRRSICMDVVWVENPFTHATDFLPQPSWRLYLNLPF
jgi:outer membrane protein assembly factor BamA